MKPNTTLLVTFSVLLILTVVVIAINFNPGLKIPHAQGLAWELNRRIENGDKLTISPAKEVDQQRLQRILFDLDEVAEEVALEHPDSTHTLERSAIQVNGNDIGYLEIVFNYKKEPISVIYSGVIPKYRAGQGLILHWSRWGEQIGNKNGRSDFNRVHLVGNIPWWHREEIYYN